MHIIRPPTSLDDIILLPSINLTGTYLLSNIYFRLNKLKITNSINLKKNITYTTIFHPQYRNINYRPFS